MKRRTLGIVLCFVALLTMPVLVALAAPARTGQLGAAQPVYEWKGAKASGVTRYVHTVQGQTVALGCQSPVAYCDDTLLEVTEEGASELVVEVGKPEGENDYDLYVYESDAEGEPGTAVGISEESPPDPERVSVKTPKKGFYLARITYFEVVDSEPLGKATVLGLTPPPTPTPTQTTGSEPPPAAPPPPPAQPSPAPAPQNTEPLSVQMTVQPPRIAAARRRGIPVRIGCNTGCRGTVDLRTDARTARRLGLGRRAVSVGRAQVSMESAGQRTLRVRLTRRAKARLARARSVKLTARAAMTSTKGTQRVTVTRRATLRR